MGLRPEEYEQPSKEKEQKKTDKMNVQQTAKLTKIPVSILLRQRSTGRSAITSGPPFRKRITRKGELIYSYDQAEVRLWMKMRRCRITAADAALILSTSRDEVMKMCGLQSREIKTKDYSGRLIIDNGKNLYMWVPN